MIDTPDIRPHIRVVVSDRPDAKALIRAREAGIPACVVPWADHSSRDQFSEAMADVIENEGAEGVVLAGFMRILSSGFVDRFPGRILNIHPSLLPAFPGADAVASALDHGVKVTGVTVHIVDEEVDHGPIVAQETVPVRQGDTVESLHRRIQEVEHTLYPRIVRLLIEDRMAMEHEVAPA